MYRIDQNGLVICPECDKHYKPILTRPEGDSRLIQQIFPDAPTWQREQIISGVCSQECWNAMLGMDGELDEKYQLISIKPDGTTTVLKEAYSLSNISHSDIDPGFFPITYVSKEDVIEALRRDKGNYTGEGNTDISGRVNAMTDSDMMELASDMADDYVNQLYWEQIPILVERYLPAEAEPAEAAEVQE